MAGVDFCYCHNVPQQPRGRVLSPPTASRGRQGSVPSSFHTISSTPLCVKSSLSLDPSSSCPRRGARRKSSNGNIVKNYQNSLMVYTICPFSDGLYDLSVFGFCNESSNPRAILCISLHDAYLNPNPRFFVLVGVALVGGLGHRWRRKAEGQ